MKCICTVIVFLISLLSPFHVMADDEIPEARITTLKRNGREVVRIESNVPCYLGALAVSDGDCDHRKLWKTYSKNVSTLGTPWDDDEFYIVPKGGSDTAINAFKLISPPGWKGSKSGTPDLIVPIKWRVMPTWLETLSDALAGTQIHAKVNWDRKNITYSIIGIAEN